MDFGDAKQRQQQRAYWRDPYVGAGLTGIGLADLGSLSLGCMDRIASYPSPRIGALLMLTLWNANPVREATR